MENMLEIENLTLAYHKKPILENFNLSVGRGDIYGIIGNNGVGKTTLLKAITGLLRYKHGKITIHAEGRKKPLIGTIIEKPGLFKDMSAYENIKAKALLLGVKYKKKHSAATPKSRLGRRGKKAHGRLFHGYEAEARHCACVGGRTRYLCIRRADQRLGSAGHQRGSQSVVKNL